MLTAMRVFRYSQLLIILVALFTGCKTTQTARTVEQPPVDTVPVRMEELRGCAVLPESWIGEDIDETAERINSVMSKIAEANYNAVFFGVGDAGSDLLKIAVESAHKQNLKIFFRFDPVRDALSNRIADLPGMKTYLKSVVANLIGQYNVDGICLDITDLSAQPFPAGALTLENNNTNTIQLARLPEDKANPILVDLIEDVMVEIMVVKPYLINSIIYNGDIAGLTASGCLEKGIADQIFGLSEIEVYSSDSILRGYPERIDIPRNLKRINPGQVIRLDLSQLISEEISGQSVFFDMMKKFKMTDNKGQIGFIVPLVDTISFKLADREVALSTDAWSVPYIYSVLPGNKVERCSPWVEFRRMPSAYTNSPEFDLLCKSEYPATVKINGQEVKQYKTGIFFNRIALDEGFNRVRATVVTEDSLTAFYEQEYFYEKVDRTRQPFPLWIDTRSVNPAYDLELIPEDVVRISFQGSKGQEGEIFLSSGDIGFRCSRRDYGDYSIYQADIPAALLPPGTPCSIKLRLIPESDENTSGFFEYTTGTTITVRYPEDFPLLRVTRENSRLIYNLGAPRLGGPIRSEIGPGIVMKMNGRFGDNYRVNLSRVEDGFIHRSEVEILPGETVQPSYYITSMSCGPSSGRDVLTIPYLEPVPYEIYPDPAQKRLVITLFGAQTSSTWITHRQGLRIIDKITWQQTTPETFQVYVNLKTTELWGYDLKVEGQRLVLRVKYPPQFDPEGEKPLEGLKVAIEAGHGGSNTGAVGLSGLLEKDINLDLSFRLGELLSHMGAEIVQVRDSDIDMTLIEKRDKAISSGADILISIHANAGGTGYLQVAGTSTYWHNPFWAPLATTIYDRLLELGLAEFGVVGSFNYTGIRLTQMPSILVEQAFMSHAEDEEKMADAEFRQQMAVRIYEGIVDYLRQLSR